MNQLLNNIQKYFLILLFSITTSLAHADESPIKIIVGFAPGGTTDVLARQIAPLLSSQLNRPVIVENRPGASGNIAANLVAQAQADGSTLLFVPSSHATNASLYKNLPFNTSKDFAAVGLIATTPYVLIVHPQIPAKNVNEFVEYLKKNPERILYATASQGTGQHIAAEFFKKMAGVEMDQVPYKGSSAAMLDVIAGRTPVMFENIAVVMPYIQSGAVRPLAVTSKKPSTLLPGIPPLSKTYPNYEIQGWFALLAPSKTPQEVIAKLNTSLKSAVDSKSFRARLEKLGAEPLIATASESDAFIKSEISRWSEVIRSSNISLD